MQPLQNKVHLVEVYLITYLDDQAFVTSNLDRVLIFINFTLGGFRYFEYFKTSY